VGTDVELGVTVTDLYGNPVPDQFVTWSGDGTFSPAVGTSPNGMTAVTWTLGTTAGEQSAAVAIDGLTATYVATATPDAAVSVAQTGAGGEYDPATALPLSITVTDQFGNTRDGDAVTWSTNSGTVAGDAATSNGGLANASWTLGNEAGDFTATAMVEGLTAIFNATVKGCTVDVDGMVDADEWSCALDDGDYFDFEANVSGGATPAQVRWQQRADSIYFLVLVEQGSLANKTNLRIDIDNRLNGATGDDDVIGSDEQTGFYDDYLTNRCANRSQAGCSSTDSNGQDGAGALGNDGTYTVYEISHPLNGDGAQDISVSPGDTFGFFLSLTNGNGAQGNTQVPAFRVYQDVVVR
jgi:hypothetical protein